MKYLIPSILVFALMAAAAAQLAQPRQTFAPHELRHSAAPPAIVWPTPPLPDHPTDVESAEERYLRVTMVTEGLEQPWSLAFLPDGSILITERPGRLRIVRHGVLDPVPLAGVPKVQ